MIKLRVGGRKFETTLEVIKNIPYIYNMISDTGVNINDLDKEIVINRSGMVFEDIFAYAIDSKHPVSEEYLYELDFYGIDYVKKYPNTKTILEDLVKLKISLIDIRDNQSVIPRQELICKGNNCNKHTVFNSFFCDSCKHQCYYKNCTEIPEGNHYLDHLIIGPYCNKRDCTNLRLDNSEVCLYHTKF